MKLLIDTNWFAMIQDLPYKKQKDVLCAILDYPNKDSDTNLWKKVIKPALEKEKNIYENKCENLKRANAQKTKKKNTESDIESDAESDTESYSNSKSNNNNIIINNNKYNNTCEENKNRVHNTLEVFGNAFKATDAVVGVFDRPDGTTKEGIRIKNPRLMAFVRQRFDKQVLNKVSDWAIDHNQRGHTYNATSLLKLLCKFQSNVEPDINFNHVQSEYLTFEYKGE